ncbi:hypothetical protein B0T09DRAFT_282101, partial [Sordaria sp. MPI-SDFR-AT-0083]
MSTTTEGLSPQVWRKLPIEFVHEILNHFVDDLLGDYDISEGEIGNGELPQLLDPWINYRHIPLFSAQKSRIERHYRDHWLSRLTMYLYLDRMMYCRYISCPEGKDFATMLPEVEVKEEGGDDGTDLEEKVTFLRGPMRSARRDIYGTTPSRTYGDVPKILPRVKANWGKTLAHWAIQLEGGPGRLGLAIRYKEQTLEDGPEEDMWTSESVIVLKGLEVLDDGRRVQFNWKKLMSKFLTPFGVHNGYRFVPGPGVGVSEGESESDSYD